MNFSEPVIAWFRLNLSDRKQCVLDSTSSNKSDWVPLFKGLPQGSVLSPLLYSLIYTFAISHTLKFCKYHLYADDMQIYAHCDISEIGQTVKFNNDDITRLCEWSKNHGLKINGAKKVVAYIGIVVISSCKKLSGVKIVF